MKQLTIGVSGLEEATSGLNVMKNRTINIQIPESMDLQKMHSDCDLLKEKILSHPEELQEMFSLAIQGRVKDAEALARTVNFSEEAFIERNGGLLWLIVGAAILLYASAAY
jgi:hypothetical protein